MYNVVSLKKFFAKTKKDPKNQVRNKKWEEGYEKK